MNRRRGLIWLLIGLLAGPAIAMDPQDGPHADLRFFVTDSAVRMNIGMNLAFVDHITPSARENPEAVAEVEKSAVLDGLMRHLAEKCPIRIDGLDVTATVVDAELLTDPDPALIGLFPRTGMRGLIRAIVTLEFPCPTPPKVVEMNWDGFPQDLISGEVGPDGVPPPMIIQAQLRASGQLQLIRFSEAQPTVVWRHADLEDDPLAAVPPVPAPAPPRTIPAASIAAGGLAGLFAVVAAIHASRRRTPVVTGVLAGAFAVTAVLAAGLQAAIPGSGGSITAPNPEQSLAIFAPLHANLYRAFDYTDESDVYDALERSVDGALLEELYRQIYASLTQAEQGGMLGVVTGIEQLETELVGARVGDGPEEPTVAFTVLHRWRVEGSVYHWGHSHTRLNEYEAEYDISALETGWRITGHRVLSQWRVDDPALTEPPAPTFDEI